MSGALAALSVASPSIAAADTFRLPLTAGRSFVPYEKLNRRY